MSFTLNLHNDICQLYLNKNQFLKITLQELNYKIKMQRIRTKVGNISFRRRNELQVSKNEQ